jgi:uncharacterized protein YidB (DUF937 family)
MNIDDAIEYLQKEKKHGVKNIIVAWWSADMFKREDDATWSEMTGWVDDNMDWSATHGALEDLMNYFQPTGANEE